MARAVNKRIRGTLWVEFIQVWEKKEKYRGFFLF